jgi:hypothetical protein
MAASREHNAGSVVRTRREKNVQAPYESEPYPDQQYYAPEPPKKTSGWLIALIVVLVLVVVCCLCLCGAMVLLGPSVGNVFSTIVTTMEAITPVP